MWRTWELLDRLRAQGLTVTRDGDRLQVEPGSRLTDTLRAEIREHKERLLRCLEMEEPAPEWTETEQAEYDATLGETAAALPDADLVDWLGNRFDMRLYKDEKGHLKAEGAGSVPQSVRVIVRQRQEGLLILVSARAPPQETVTEPDVEQLVMPMK